MGLADLYLFLYPPAPLLELTVLEAALGFFRQMPDMTIAVGG